jgi:hypothetical protein
LREVIKKKITLKTGIECFVERSVEQHSNGYWDVGRFKFVDMNGNPIMVVLEDVKDEDLVEFSFENLIARREL